MRNHHSERTCRPHARGVTTIEVLVVCSIIALIASLLLPAVQASREASRGVTCRSRIRQIGVALLNYETAHRVFPPAAFSIPFHLAPRIDAFSVYARLLPYLDQETLHRKVNWNGNGSDPPTMFQGTLPKVSEFQCPSASGDAPTGASFAFATGVLPGPAVTTGLPNGLARLGGSFSVMALRTDHFQDGLSNTVGFSEIRYGSAGGFDPSRDAAIVSTGSAAYFTRHTPSFWISKCSAVVPPVTVWNARRGQTWLSYYDLTYSHILTPNSRVVDCEASGHSSHGLYSTRSDHSGKVHAGTMDGAVHSIANTISARVWWAFGTRFGDDFVDN